MIQRMTHDTVEVRDHDGDVLTFIHEGGEWYADINDDAGVFLSVDDVRAIGRWSDSTAGEPWWTPMLWTVIATMLAAGPLYALTTTSWAGWVQATAIVWGALLVAVIGWHAGLSAANYRAKAPAKGDDDE